MTLPSAAQVGPSLEPFEHSDPAWYGEGSAKRTEIAAVESLDEKADSEQPEREDDEWPVAHELQDNRGLERLYLSRNLGHGH